jgi:hypothetical protein
LIRTLDRSAIAYSADMSRRYYKFDQMVK